MRAGLWTVAAVFAVTAMPVLAEPAFAEEVPNGVYDCFGPSMAAGRALDVSEGAPAASRLTTSAGKFSVLSPGLYLSRGGKTGHFRFDGRTLAMIDGPYAGLRYHRAVPYWSFRLLRENGDEGPFMCPRNTAKNPRTPNAW